MTMPLWPSQTGPSLGENPAPLEVIDVLGSKLRGSIPALTTLDQYYRGTQPLNFLPQEVLMAIGDRLKSLMVNLPRLVVETIEEGLNVTGFALADTDQGDPDLWGIWQGNGFDRASSRLHLRALKHGRAFVSVWSNPKNRDMPQLAIESALHMTVDMDPITQVVRSALKMWQDGPNSYATVYLPDQILRYQHVSDVLRAAPGVDWVLRTDVQAEVANPLGVVPIVPYFNRWDEDAQEGETELADILPFADAVNKLCTDMMVTSEFHAAPRRWATGIEQPDGDNSERMGEQAKEYWDRATAGRTWLAGDGVTFGQFAAAELSNFAIGIKQLLMLAGAVSTLPPHYLSMATDNPASADAIRESRSRLDLRTRRRMLNFSEDHETVMRLAVRVRDGNSADPLLGLQTLWANPSTPTPAETADASAKLLALDVIDVPQAQEDNGYSPTQRAAMAERREAAAKAQADAATAARVQEALAMMDEGGIPAQVAFAAVGLITLSKGAKPGPESPVPPSGDPEDSGTT